MEGSGAIVNIVPVVAPDGSDTRTKVISSRDTVEIGGWTFRRDDLLLAIGVSDKLRVNPHMEDSNG
jgi:hypothetical protein